MHTRIRTLHIALKRHAGIEHQACLRFMHVHHVCKAWVHSHTRSCTRASSACSLSRNLAPTLPSNGAVGGVRLVDRAAHCDIPACSGSLVGRLQLPRSVWLSRASASLFMEELLGFDSELEVPGLAFCLCINMTSNKFRYALTSQRMSLIHGMAYDTLYLSHTLFLTCLHTSVIGICFYVVLLSYADLHVLHIYFM